jgi:hypothetical protein
MARKKSPLGNPTSKSESVLIAGPRTKAQPKAVSVGVVGTAPPQVARGGHFVSAASAGETSTLFSKGGDAFAAYCHDQGINIDQKRQADEWDTLLQEFADKPIYGCRRGPAGGDHRPSPESLG